MKITSEQINDIAQELDSGMNVYLNLDTLETTSIVDLDLVSGDTEYWEEELEKVKTEWSSYIVLKGMKSTESFKIMEDFIDEVDDQALKTRLSNCLARKSPFANFKNEIETSDYRQQWFDFKQAMIEKYVKRLLKSESIECQ